MSVEDPGDSNLLPEEVISNYYYEKLNHDLQAKNQKLVTASPTILGIKKIPLMSPSFLAAASFQNTPQILAAAAIEGKIDLLKDPKSNIIVGNLIPIGTGLLSKSEMEELIMNYPDDDRY
jgi:DNA-directed RNA polymerase subunit beta'